MRPMNGSALRLYTVVVLPAGVLMALEMVSSRILAPQFGTSVYVWGSIIGVYLAAMSIGYTWGGWLADRRPRLGDLGVLLAASGAAQIIVLLVGQQVTAYIGGLTQGASWGTLVVTAVLFGPPTILLATVSPFAVRLASEDLEGLGGLAGRLYALSTAGSLVGTLGATFVLIPSMELERILELLIVLTAVSAAIALYGELRRRRLAASLVAVMLVVALMPRGDSLGDHVVERRMTPYQTLELHDTGAVLSLYSDGALHTAMHKATGEPTMGYIAHSPTLLLAQPEGKSALVLGMGGGSFGRIFGEGAGVEVEFVEIDPVVVEMAKEHFRFEDDDKVFVDDGRRFLARNPGRTWDYIYVDTYIGYSIPFHLSTREFFAELKRHLAPGGVVGLNIAARPDDPLTRSIYRTLRTVFEGVLVFETSGNLLLLACDQCSQVSRETLAERGRRWDERFDFAVSLEDLAGHLVETPPDLTDAIELTDAFAPVNHLMRFDRDPRSLTRPPSPDGDGGTPAANESSP